MLHVYTTSQISLLQSWHWGGEQEYQIRIDLEILRFKSDFPIALPEIAEL